MTAFKRCLWLGLLALMLVGCASPIKAPPPEERDPRDPWEGYNRSMHEFNMRMDRAVLRPVAVGYERVIPRPARRGVSNFFSNLRMPIVALNQLLQGKPRQAAETSGRFLMNTTWGVAGLMDVATRGDIPRHSADFGQTLGVWGWEESRYFVLPLLGPSTLRDTTGRATDIAILTAADAPWTVTDARVGIPLNIVDVIQTRASFLAQEALMRDAYDQYALFRDGYLQRRNYMIHDGDVELPDYDALLENDWDEDWD